MSDSSQQITPEAVWKHIVEDGQEELVDLETSENLEKKPEWFDADRFARAKQAMQRHFIGLVDELVFAYLSC